MTINISNVQVDRIKWGCLCLFFTGFLVSNTLFNFSEAREKFLNIQEHTTPSGLTFWLLEDPSIPLLSLQFAFENAGSKNDSKDKQGLSRMVSNTMDEGAGDLDATTFQEELRRNSISLSLSSGRDTYGGSLKTRTSTKERAGELLEIALKGPHFKHADIIRMREANIARIRSSLSDPDWIAARFTNDIAFGDHPYALNSGGTITTLQNITTEDLETFVRTRLAKENLKIALAGDITADQAKVWIEQIFGHLPQTTSGISNVADFKVRNDGQVYHYALDIPQTIIRSVQPALSRTHPDYYAYTVMNQILGAGGFGSRLTEEIRENRGLTYGIYTSLTQMAHVDFLMLGVSTANENTFDVLGLTRLEMKKMQTEFVSEEELQNAISYINGSLPLTLSSTSNIASLLLGMQLDDLPINYLDERAAKFHAVSAEDVQNIAKTYLNPEQMTTIIVGNPPNIEEIDHVTALEHIPNAE